MFRLSALLAALVLVAVACGSTSPPAASVSGTEISQSELEDDVALVTAAQLELVEQGLASPDATVADPPSVTDIASILSRRIWTIVLADAIEERGGEVPEVTDDLSGEQLNALAVALAGEELGIDPEAPLDEVVGDLPPEVLPICSSHILVATEDEAVEVIERLDGGEAFVEVAGEVSTDPGSGANGGSLGCVPAATFVPEFAEALMGLSEGETSGAVESQFGFHIILHEGVDTSTATTGELVAVAGNDIVLAVLAAAEVDVLERLGEWDPEATPPQVIVPLS